MFKQTWMALFVIMPALVIGAPASAGAVRADTGWSIDGQSAKVLSQSTVLAQLRRPRRVLRRKVPLRRPRAVIRRSIIRSRAPNWRGRYWGRVAFGVTLGTIIVVAANAVPVAPDPSLCWTWSDGSVTRGYWYYCEGE